MTDFEKNCYGMTQTAIRNQYMNGITAQFSGLEMVVMGILSDCQDMIAMKNKTIASPATDEYIRKQLNIAKFILSEMMDIKETA
jgi:hypothetical protein